MAGLALKVDIDTYEGMEKGVPRILRVLDDLDVRASFFVSFGPDRSGLAVIQLLRPKFFMKMVRTDAKSLYGLRTALSGTLLPARRIGLSFPGLLREIEERGHEVACHAWDHRLWQDWLFLMGESRIEKWFDMLVKAYGDVLGHAPAAFGAPGWCIDGRVLDVVSRFGFEYLSCTRADRPFVFRENGMLEVPSNLPCIEERGVDGVIAALHDREESEVPLVLPVHAEVEGGPYCADFENILGTALDLGYSVERLDTIASGLESSSLDVRPCGYGLVHGRAFKCAI